MGFYFPSWGGDVGAAPPRCCLSCSLCPRGLRAGIPKGLSGAVGPCPPPTARVGLPQGFLNPLPWASPQGGTKILPCAPALSPRGLQAVPKSPKPSSPRGASCWGGAKRPHFAFWSKPEHPTGTRPPSPCSSRSLLGGQRGGLSITRGTAAWGVLPYKNRVPPPDCLWSVEPHRRVCTLRILQQNIF